MVRHLIQYCTKSVKQATDIQHGDLACVQFKLSPCNGFEEFFQSSITTRKCDVGIGQVVHHRLSFVHIGRDSHVSNAVMHEFRTCQMFRDYSNDRATMTENGVCEDAHHSSAAATIDERVATLSDECPKYFRRFSEFF